MDGLHVPPQAISACESLITDRAIHFYDVLSQEASSLYNLGFIVVVVANGILFVGIYFEIHFKYGGDFSVTDIL